MEYSVFLYVITLMLVIWASFSRPTLLACLYIIYQTSYLGLASQEVLIRGSDFGSFTINMSLLFPIIFRVGQSRSFDKHTKIAIAYVTIFSLYGVLVPFLKGDQTLIMGIMASKGFLTYLFLIYLMVFRESIDYRSVFKTFLFCSFLFAALYIINHFGIRIVPPVYEKYNYIQCRFDSFLPLSILFLFFLKRRDEIVHLFYLKIVFLLFGIYLGGYFSLFITSFIISLFLIINSKRIPSYWFSLSLIVIILAVVYFCFYDQPWFLSLSSEQIASIESRNVNNEFRIDYIKEHLFFGGGFLYKTSNIVQAIADSDFQYRNTMAFIDSGYIDLLCRFGIVGMLLFLSYPINLMLKSARVRSLFPFSLLILQFIFINYTWSVFSFPHGIVVLSVIYSFIIHNLYDE